MFTFRVDFTFTQSSITFVKHSRKMTTDVNAKKIPWFLINWRITKYNDWISFSATSINPFFRLIKLFRYRRSRRTNWFIFINRMWFFFLDVKKHIDKLLSKFKRLSIRLVKASYAVSSTRNIQTEKSIDKEKKTHKENIIFEINITLLLF